MHVAITSLTLTFIIVASSDTDTNSVTFNIFFSSFCLFCSTTARSLAANRLSLRYFDPFVFFEEVSLAKVSFICLCTCLSSTSFFTGRFLFLLNES